MPPSFPFCHSDDGPVVKFWPKKAAESLDASSCLRGLPGRERESPSVGLLPSCLEAVRLQCLEQLRHLAVRSGQAKRTASLCKTPSSCWTPQTSPASTRLLRGIGWGIRFEHFQLDILLLSAKIIHKWCISPSHFWLVIAILKTTQLNLEVTYLPCKT